MLPPHFSFGVEEGRWWGVCCSSFTFLWTLEMGSDLNGCELSIASQGPKVRLQSDNFDMDVHVCRAVGSWRFPREFPLLVPRSKPFSHPVYMMLGNIRDPSLVHLGCTRPPGTPEANGLEPQQAVPWECEGSPDFHGNGIPCQIQMPRLPWGTTAPPKWRKSLGEVKQTALKGCARVCVCVCVCVWKESSLYIVHYSTAL